MNNLSDKRELLRYVGDISQVFEIKQYEYTDGKAKGMRGIDVTNGSGISFSILPDRGMDISTLRYNGVNCGVVSKTGLVSSKYYEKDGDDFLRSFNGGFLTTCGLRNFGAQCTVGNETLPMHGRLSHTAAENVCVERIWEDDEPKTNIQGTLSEAKVFAENLKLTRQYSCGYLKDEIKIVDKVENLGFKAEPLMLLYHFNFGYPLLNENTRVFLSDSDFIAKNTASEKMKDAYLKVNKPQENAESLIYFHEFKKSEKPLFAGIENEALGIKLEIIFNHEQLNRMTQLKHFGESEYMLCLEPANSLPSLGYAMENETVQYIQPGEMKEFELRIRFSKI